MKKIAMLLVAVVVVFAGCGGSDDAAAPMASEPKDAMEKEDGDVKKDGGAKKDAAAMVAAKGTTITVAGSEFGPILFDSKKQAIYIFENDSEGKTVCYGECAEAWPPVFTDGEPKAGEGVKQSLLGTVKRRDGKLQVTYAGKPLYFYAHEGPGEVRCHNVDLNGGLWWVVGPDGRRRP